MYTGDNLAVGVDGVRHVIETLNSCRNVLSIAAFIVNVLSRNYEKNTQYIEAIDHLDKWLKYCDVN
jgi:hypothetical protein